VWDPNNAACSAFAKDLTSDRSRRCWRHPSHPAAPSAGHRRQGPAHRRPAAPLLRRPGRSRAETELAAARDQVNAARAATPDLARRTAAAVAYARQYRLTPSDLDPDEHAETEVKGWPFS
jgi:hypothetical protein